MNSDVKQYFRWNEIVAKYRSKTADQLDEIEIYQYVKHALKLAIHPAARIQVALILGRSGAFVKSENATDFFDLPYLLGIDEYDINAVFFNEDQNLDKYWKFPLPPDAQVQTDFSMFGRLIEDDKILISPHDIARIEFEQRQRENPSTLDERFEEKEFEMAPEDYFDDSLPPDVLEFKLVSKNYPETFNENAVEDSFELLFLDSDEAIVLSQLLVPTICRNDLALSVQDFNSLLDNYQTSGTNTGKLLVSTDEIEKPLTETERENLLTTIGVLSLLLSNHGETYRHGSDINRAEIFRALNEQLIELLGEKYEGTVVAGHSRPSVLKRVSEALDLVRKVYGIEFEDVYKDV